MSYFERIQSDLTAAMKEKDELRLSVLRMVKSALKNKEIEKIRPLDDLESLQVLQTLVKQRRESIDQFTKGGRKDLADKEAQGNRDYRGVSAGRAQRRRKFSAPSKRPSVNERRFAEANGRGG